MLGEINGAMQQASKEKNNKDDSEFHINKMKMKEDEEIMHKHITITIR